MCLGLFRSRFRPPQRAKRDKASRGHSSNWNKPGMHYESYAQWLMADDLLQIGVSMQVETPGWYVGRCLDCVHSLVLRSPHLGDRTPLAAPPRPYLAARTDWLQPGGAGPRKRIDIKDRSRRIIQGPHHPGAASWTRSRWRKGRSPACDLSPQRSDDTRDVDRPSRSSLPLLQGPKANGPRSDGPRSNGPLSEAKHPTRPRTNASPIEAPRPDMHKPASPGPDPARHGPAIPGRSARRRDPPARTGVPVGVRPLRPARRSSLIPCRPSLFLLRNGSRLL